MPLIHTIYTSTATKEMSDLVLRDLLATAVKNNEKIGLTGMLLHRKGRFMQVLEGEAEFVDQVMAAIKKDPRHTSVFILERHAIPVRHFSKWSMGFHQVDDEDIKLHPNYVDFFSDEFNSQANKIQLGLALMVLQSFAQNLE